jgi:hypothetical protein
VNHWLRRAALAAVLTFATERAHAQITTVIAAPKRPDPVAQQQAARVERATQDSVARVTLTGMTQWVDSAAAALALRPDTGTTPISDTSAAPARTPVPSRADSASDARRDTTGAMRSGARAPDTATVIPTIALVGAVMILVGLVMRGRHRREWARARR